MKKKILLVAAFIFVVASFTACGKNTKVNPEDYINVSFNGYSGYGTAEISVDRSTLNADYFGEIQWNKELEKKAKKDDFEASLVMGLGSPIDYVDFDVTLSNDTALSNGDEITITWTPSVDVAYTNAIVKEGSMTVKVEGLLEVSDVLTSDLLAQVKAEHDDYMSTCFTRFESVIYSMYGYYGEAFGTDLETVQRNMAAAGMPQEYLDNGISYKEGWLTGGYVFDITKFHFKNHESKIVASYACFSKTSSDVMWIFVFDDLIEDDFASVNRYNVAVCRSITPNDDGTVYLERNYISHYDNYYDSLDTIYNDFVNANKAEYDIVEMRY